MGCDQGTGVDHSGAKDRSIWLWTPKIGIYISLIREIPDHATFRGKGANTAWLDKLGLFPSLAICNKANFGYLQFPKYSVLYKM